MAVDAGLPKPAKSGNPHAPPFELNAPNQCRFVKDGHELLRGVACATGTADRFGKSWASLSEGVAPKARVSAKGAKVSRPGTTRTNGRFAVQAVNWPDLRSVQGTASAQRDAIEAATQLQPTVRD